MSKNFGHNHKIKNDDITAEKNVKIKEMRPKSLIGLKKEKYVKVKE